MIIDDHLKYIYIAIPKTGTSSVHLSLQPNTDHPAPAKHHAGIRQLIVDYPRIEDYFKFAFVRNPWDKIWSTYADFTMRRIKQYSEFVEVEKPLLSEFSSFEDFCCNLKDSKWYQDIFFRPQSELVTLENGHEIDFIGRYETFVHDFYKVVNHLKIPVHYSLEHRNKGLYDGNYRSYYSANAKQAIQSLYKEDIERFAYEF